MDIVKVLKKGDKVSEENREMSIYEFLATWSQGAFDNAKYDTLSLWNFSNDKILASLYGIDTRTDEASDLFLPLRKPDSTRHGPAREMRTPA